MWGVGTVALTIGGSQAGGVGWGGAARGAGSLVLPVRTHPPRFCSQTGPSAASWPTGDRRGGSCPSRAGSQAPGDCSCPSSPSTVPWGPRLEMRGRSQAWTSGLQLCVTLSTQLAFPRGCVQPPRPLPLSGSLVPAPRLGTFFRDQDGGRPAGRAAQEGGCRRAARRCRAERPGTAPGLRLSLVSDEDVWPRRSC